MKSHDGDILSYYIINLRIHWSIYRTQLCPTLVTFVNVTPIVGVCNCSMFCCTLLCVHSSFAIVLKGKRDLVALLSLSFLVSCDGCVLFLAVPCVCLRFVIVVFSDHTHLLFVIPGVTTLSFNDLLTPLYD